MRTPKPQQAPRDAAKGLAVQALTYLASEPERAARFLATTGLDGASIRAAAADPGFLVGVLDYVLGEEALVLEFAAEAGVDPAAIARARAALAGRAWERDIP